MISESSYMELLKGCANWNERAMRERMGRMPYVDAQTNTAQRAAGHLWRDANSRRVVRCDNGAASYEYPAERWKRLRPDASTTFVDKLVRDRADEITGHQQQSHTSVSASVQSVIAASAAAGLEPEKTERVRTTATEPGTLSTPKHVSTVGGGVGGKQSQQSLDYDELSDSVDEADDGDDDGDDYEEPGAKRRTSTRHTQQQHVHTKGRRANSRRPHGNRPSAASAAPSIMTSTSALPAHASPHVAPHLAAAPPLHQQHSSTPSSKAATPQPNVPSVSTVAGGDEKPFGCATCGARYKSRAGLNYHMAHVHAEQWAVENARRPPVNVAALCAEQPQDYCDFCLGDKSLNKRTNAAEMLVACHDCGRAGHPTCLALTDNMQVSTRKYGWQCIECKSCAICGTSDNDDVLLFCDDCDRGFHLYCLRPPLAAAPDGEWSCHLCQVEFGSRASLPSAAATRPAK